MTLSDKIPKIPKGLTCACGKCDLRMLRVEDIKQTIKKIIDKKVKLKLPSGRYAYFVSLIELEQEVGKGLMPSDDNTHQQDDLLDTSPAGEVNDKESEDT